MTRFDAPRYLPAESVSPVRSARACIVARPSVIVIAVVSASLLIAAALIVLLFSETIPRMFDALVDQTPISVIVDSQMPRSEVEAMRSRLLGQRSVGRAELRTREQALASLGSEMVALARGSNPLPDVWLVTLRPAPVDGSIAGHFRTEMAVIRTWSGVNAATVDQGWVDRIDRWHDESERLRKPAMAWFAIYVGTLLLGVSYLASRACGTGQDAGMAALACVGMLVSVVSCALGVATAWFASAWSIAFLSERWKPIALPMGPIDTSTVIAILVGAALIITLGSALGTPRQ